MTELQSYPAYRDSGVEWLGTVPEHWEVRRLKYAVSFSGGGTPSKTNASFWKGQIPWVSPKDMARNRISDTADHITEDAVAASAAKIVVAGAVLVVVRSGILRRTIPVAINTVPMALNQDMKAMRPRKGIRSEYLRGLIQGNQSFWLREWTKQGATVESIEHRLLANSRIPIPPLSEQRAIARFLDDADRRIRRYIRAKKRLVELLEEERQATIHEAVMGRIDVRTGRPYPAYKDSGVEWLGEVPEHWEVAGLWYRYAQCLGKMLDGKRITGEHLVPYLRNVDVQWDEINVADLPRMDIHPDEIPRYTVQPGDLLVCEGGEVGRCAIWKGEIDRCGFQKALHRLRPRDDERDRPRFLYYAISVAVSRGAFADGHESTIAHLTGEKLRHHRFAFPFADEQTAIVRYLAAADRRISARRETVARQIALLREYRARLIAEVVTGKLDVREAAAALPDIAPPATEGTHADAAEPDA